MLQEVTIEQLAQMIADGFANTATKEDIKGLKVDIAAIDARLGVVETKLDKALYKEIDLHERWIKQLATKVGLVLEV